MDLRNISRLDGSRSHGYRVRFEQGGCQLSKLFSDLKYGGADAALEAAVSYRDAQRPLIRTSQHDIGVYSKDWGTNTNYLGIEFSGEPRVVVDPEEFFTAQVRLSPKKVVSRKFQCKSAGWAKTLQVAIAWQRSVLKGRRRN